MIGAVQREPGNVKERAEKTRESNNSLCVVDGLRVRHKEYDGENVRIERGKRKSSCTAYIVHKTCTVLSIWFLLARNSEHGR